jgi:hypothetical protein
MWYSTRWFLGSYYSLYDLLTGFSDNDNETFEFQRVQEFHHQRSYRQTTPSLLLLYYFVLLFGSIDAGTGDTLYIFNIYYYTIIPGNCLLQRVIEGKIKGGIEVIGRRERKRRKLLDDLKERKGYSHLKEEALDRTMWRARFGRGLEPVVRQTTKWMNYTRNYICSHIYQYFTITTHYCIVFYHFNNS